MLKWLKNLYAVFFQPAENKEPGNVVEIAQEARDPRQDSIARDEDPSDSLRKRKHRSSFSKSTTENREKKQTKKLLQEQKKAQKIEYAQNAQAVNEYTNLAQTYGGLFSLSTAMTFANKTVGSINFGWIFFLGGLVKGFGSIVNVFRGDRSIASPLGLVEAPIEMVLGAAMTAISALLITMSDDDPAYTRLQIANGILSGMIVGLLSLEQGYHRIRTLFNPQTANPLPSINDKTKLNDADPAKQIELKKQAHRMACANNSHSVNDYVNIAQSYGGLFTLSAAMTLNSPTAGSENFGWILFLGGLVKGFGSGINIIRGDRSIAGPLGLIEAPIEMALGAAMLSISSTLLALNPDDSSYTLLQMINGILAGMASGLLTMEQGYHKIRRASSDQATPALSPG